MKNNIKKIFSDIEKIRSKNNKNWMNLLKLCFKYNPEASKRILKQIFAEDKRINKLVKDLVK